MPPPDVHVPDAHTLEAEGRLPGARKGHRLFLDVPFEVEGDLDGQGVLPQPPQEAVDQQSMPLPAPLTGQYQEYRHVGD